MSQAELAKILGVHRSSIRRWGLNRHALLMGKPGRERVLRYDLDAVIQELEDWARGDPE